MPSALLKKWSRYLPASTADTLRRAYYGLANPRQWWWVHRHYLPYAYGQRRDMMLAIARFCNINRPMRGYYFEFGCFEANTMRQAWRHTRHLFDWTYVAFDSFEGLPEIQEIDRQEIWASGKLKMSEQAFLARCHAAGMPRDRLITVKGFYDQSLNEETRDRFAGRKAVVCYIDCDLYASTVPVLAFVRPFLQQGTIIVFDDWACFHADPDRGEKRAWREFLAANPDVRFEPFYGTVELQAFVCVAP